MTNSGKSTQISFPEYSEKDSRKEAVVGTDEDSNGSWTEEVESPRSVAPSERGDGGKNINDTNFLFLSRTNTRKATRKKEENLSDDEIIDYNSWSTSTQSPSSIFLKVMRAKVKIFVPAFFPIILMISIETFNVLSKIYLEKYLKKYFFIIVCILPASNLPINSKHDLFFLVGSTQLEEQRTMREGWVRRQVKNPESIADHMYRMRLMALI
ncbi:HD domain [Forsythia ovata]|uniref:HD domain n=1 Tax=Forsythia ovata TaxID=205694 RepID=A0ABD1WIU4_9LAMI